MTAQVTAQVTQRVRNESAQAIRSLASKLRSLGVSEEEILAASGLPKEALANPDTE